MSNFFLTTPDKNQWSVIDRWEYFRFEKNGGKKPEDIMYEDEMIAKYGENFADNTF